jgi:hypothetical protein
MPSNDQLTGKDFYRTTAYHPIGAISGKKAGEGLGTWQGDNLMLQDRVCRANGGAHKGEPSCQYFDDVMSGAAKMTDHSYFDWSAKWEGADFDEFLLASGDCSKWLIISKEEMDKARGFGKKGHQWTLPKYVDSSDGKRAEVAVERMTSNWCLRVNNWYIYDERMNAAPRTYFLGGSNVFIRKKGCSVSFDASSMEATTQCPMKVVVSLPQAAADSVSVEELKAGAAEALGVSAGMVDVALEASGGSPQPQQVSASQKDEIGTALGFGTSAGKYMDLSSVPLYPVSVAVLEPDGSTKAVDDTQKQALKEKLSSPLGLAPAFITV